MASRVLAVALALTAFLLGTPSARAAETPMPVSYLDPYNMDWLAYLDPADVPANPYAVCVVDTGVAITPDTPPDNPAGPIVKRYAFDGGTGEPQTANAFGLHGTRMAMAAAAPVNDWGTVGAWPGARIISMRATKNQEQFIRLLYYDQSAFECVDTVANHRVASVLWSLSCESCEPTQTQAASFQDTIVAAHQRGVSVVAAAGNEAGEVHYPAAQPGVFSVAAGAPDGALCPDSAFAENVAAIGPGCPVETADPLTGIPQVFSDGGTSTAATVAATLIAALRSLQPSSTQVQVERWLRKSALRSDGRRVLNGEAAARLAGLGPEVDRAILRMPVPTSTGVAQDPMSASTTATTPSPEDGLLLTRLHAPVRSAVRMRLRGREIEVRVRDRPPRALLEVRAAGRSRTGARNALSVRVGRGLKHADLRYSPSQDQLVQSSAWLRLRRVSGGRFR